MKLSAFFLLITLFGIQTNSFSQKKVITLSIKDASIVEVINEIENSTDYKFIYRLKDIQTSKKVSLNVKKESVESVLNLIFTDDSIFYKILNQQIVLKKKPDTSTSSEQRNSAPYVITGVVTSDTGLILPNVNVILKGTNKGVITDFDGYFEITIPNNNDNKLVFSYIGFDEKEITVNRPTKINVILRESNESLNELVIRAYKNTTKERSTASISTISSKKLENRPNIALLNNLQALVSGLFIGSGNGLPGFSPSVTIRGVGSVNGNTRPLFIVDGTPVDPFEFRGLNSNDIENVSVLKDAASTAIHGNRGANGVIIITTKKGNYNKGLEVDFSSSYGQSSQQKNKLNLLDSKGLLEIQKKLDIGVGSNLSDTEINVLANQNNTDWTDFIFREGKTRNYNLSVSNGAENSRLYSSLSYSKQEGIIQNTGLERYTFTTNVSGKSNRNKFKYDINYTGSFAESEVPFDIGTGNLFFNPISAALFGQPFLSPYNTDGTLNNKTIDNNAELPLSSSPFVILNNIRFNNGIDDKIVKNIASVKTEFEIIKDLTLKSTVGLDHNQLETLNVIHPESTIKRFFPNNAVEFQGRVIETSSRTTSLNLNTSLNYKKIFNKHSIDISAYTESFRSFLKSLGFTQEGLDPRTFTPGDDASFITGTKQQDQVTFFRPAVSSNRLQGNLLSFFSIIDYDYDNRLGFSGTIRRDGTFRFSPSKRWGTFYSISGRWNLHNESFLSDSAISQLKLRLSYGKTGNQLVNGTSFFNNTRLSRTNFSTVSGFNNTQGLALTNLGNPNAQWETINQFNFGIDYGFFSNKLRGSIDIYNKITEDLFIAAPISAINGQSTIFDNLGSLRNRGLDFAAQCDLISNKNLRLTLFGNINFNENEILDLNGDENDNTQTINRVGSQINAFFLVPYVGVNPANGNALYRNKEGNITEVFNAEDRVVNNSAIPKYQGNFGFATNYKGFSLDSNFSFVSHYMRFNDLQRFLENDPRKSLNQNVSANLLRAWTPDNPITDIEGLNSLQSNIGSDKFLQDASYIRLRNLTLGYNLKSQILKHLPISAFKIFIQGENLLTWTNWKGLDVESDLDRRFDFTQFPNPRIVSFGANVKF